jgi:hypothetical protein
MRRGLAHRVRDGVSKEMERARRWREQGDGVSKEME